MKRRPATAAEAARLLRQRLEVGPADVVLGTLGRDEALALARKAREVPGSAGERGPTGASTREPPAAAPRPPRGAGRPPVDPRKTPTLDAPVPAEQLPSDYDALRELALGCTLCRLSETRTQVVFSDGARDARLMVVGEAPGANEDATGRPFVGAAGRFLDLLLATVGLSREETVYIANVLKCRPPGNRNPQADEIAACSPYLKRQIELVAPEALLAVGTFSARLLTGQETSLGRLRGTVHGYEGVPLVVTYHPAALLRNPKWTRPTWDDLQLLRDVLDGG